MRIGIDARLIHETGVGRYIRNLIRELAEVDQDNDYVVFLRARDFNHFTPPNPRWHKKKAEVAWHSLAEQFIMPWILLREHLDFLHVPYFNTPIFYPGKYIVTIHDLTILHFDTGKASTLPYWVYKLRRFGYRIVLFLAIKRASHIIAVSEAVKRDILTSFRETDERVTVTYEGIDPDFLHPLKVAHEETPVEGKFFLYVGNVYPHKNIEVLLSAYTQYKNHVQNPAKLLFVGPADYFYKQMEMLLPSLDLDRHVVILHNQSDAALAGLYRRAVALLFPSRMEGFGLPALEAVACGCPVICSDIPVFHEILGGYALYAKVDSPEDFASKMTSVSLRPHDPKTLRGAAPPVLTAYSWKKMAEKTYSLYKKFGQTA
jgi:glycosyltransferase involved in cell wall biosynthesis